MEMESLPATRRVGVAAPLSVFRPAAFSRGLDLDFGELFAAALSKRAIMEAWEGSKGGDLQT